MNIIQYDVDLNIIELWNSILEAANALGIKQQGICNCLKERTKTASGFKWKYNN